MSTIALRSLAAALAVAVVLPAHAGAMQVLEPNGGEDWTAGETRTIRWTSSGSGTVRIEYGYVARFPVYLIADGAADTGTFEWQVVNLPTPNALIRVTHLDTGESDRSDARFLIHHIPAAQSAGSIYPSAIANGRVGELSATPGIAFDFYIVIDNDAAAVGNPPASGISAWEARVNVPVDLVVLERALTLPSAIDFIPDANIWVVGTGGVCIGDDPFAVVRYRAMLMFPYSDLVVSIGPAAPTSFEDGSPGWSNGGCAGDEVGGLWPFPERHELVINPAGVPAAAVSWGEIKATY